MKLIGTGVIKTKITGTGVIKKKMLGTGVIRSLAPTYTDPFLYDLIDGGAPDTIYDPVPGLIDGGTP